MKSKRVYFPPLYKRKRRNISPSNRRPERRPAQPSPAFEKRRSGICRKGKKNRDAPDDRSQKKTSKWPLVETLPITRSLARPPVLCCSVLSTIFHRSSSSTSIASGFAATGWLLALGLFPPSGPELAATKPCGARAWRSSAAIASAFCADASSSSSSSLSPLRVGGCWLRAMAWEAMKLTSVL